MSIDRGGRLRVLRRRPAGEQSRTGRVVAAIAVVAFLLVDLALVWFAVRQTHPHTAAQGEVPAVPLPTPSASTPAVPAQQQPTNASLPAPAPQIAPVSATVAWRVTPGACASGSVPQIERTEDAGAHWTASPVRELDARALFALVAIDPSSVRAVAGVGAACTPTAIESFTQGQFWRSASEPVTAWYPDPASTNAVRTVERSVMTPCTTVSSVASRTPAEALVVCSSASAQFTADGGATWRDPAGGAHVALATATGDGYLVGVLGADGCAGTAIEDLDVDAGSLAPLSCVAVDAAAAPTAIGASGSVVWLWSGDRVSVSTDGGRTWSPQP